MRLATILVAFFLLPAIGFAATIYVPDDYDKIQTAIIASTSGDTIIVRPGTYVENIDFVGKAITLTSALGPEVTVIDGSKAGSVVTFQSGENDYSVIEGFTITNGDAGSGGGIYISQAYPDILGNVITGNNGFYGGGLYCYACNSYIDGNTVTGNTAVAGGGLCCQWASPQISSNMIAGNSSSWSGGIELYESYSEVINNTIMENSAGNSGGGLYCWGNCSPLIVNTIFWNNTSPEGPEIWIGKTTGPSTVTISHSDVKDGQSSVHVETGCGLNWGAGMINLDPLFVHPASGDLHLTFASPCRNSGDSSPYQIYSDFEGDPRIVSGTVDMGADEFHFHLYHVGDVTPGNQLSIRTIGGPGMPVLLAHSLGIQNPAQLTPYGDLYLTRPPRWSSNIGMIQANGVNNFTITVPSYWNPGDEKYFQALVGSSGVPMRKLTNLMTLTVE